MGFKRLQGRRLNLDGAENSRHQPPDLDELWRDFNRRLSRLFGLKESGSGGRGPWGGKNSHYYQLGLGGAFALVLWLGSGVYIVGEDQAGVISQLGKYKYTTTSTGLQWHFPYPFQSSALVDLKPVQPVEIGSKNASSAKNSPMLTQDGKLVDARFTVQYQIDDAYAFLFNNIDARVSIEQAGEAAARTVLSQLKLNDLLSRSQETTGFEVKQSLQKVLDLYHTGIHVKDVTMQAIRLPAQIQEAFDDALKVTQENERQNKQAEAYSHEILTRARADVAQMINEAEGHKARVIAQAQGDAERFKQVLAEYSKAPQVIREHMYLDTMQQIYADATKVLIENKAAQNLIYLPFDKLLANSALSKSTAPDASQSNGAATINPPASTPHAAGQPAATVPALAKDRPPETTRSMPAAGADPMRTIRELPRTRDRNDDGR
ncbi:FtsH protease activity modulator HflK [Mycoavidus sp. B2-EB]|uniref:FtsH protease activity modulator HflK n=1 Tax=Mycoavidus sp. B2-EB TaxID=2651972 RepID=UPI00162ADE56|nr:FtsH protease activity modulator HflK [Mycoavidus sp. B2-EB]BBO59463.1 protease modulator HflK [Mycoavidus sp. B2-EB]